MQSLFAANSLRAPCAVPVTPEDLPMFLGFDEASSTAGVDVRVANFDGLTPVVVFEDSTFDFRGPLPADDGSLTLFQSGVQPLMSLRFALSLARPWLLPVALCPLLSLIHI